jgi:hypothetical protein
MAAIMHIPEVTTQFPNGYDEREVGANISMFVGAWNHKFQIQ